MCFKEDCGQPIDRRAFITTATAAAVGGIAVPGADARQAQPGTPALPVNPETRVLDDPRVRHGPVSFTHNGKPTIDGFLARPKADGVYPAVLVIAGNRITEEYIPNTCAALALAGFVGLAPNVFHPLTDAARTLDEMRAALAGHTDADVLLDVQAGIDYLRTQPFARPGGVGVVGFCFGGKIAMLLGARSREVVAVVPYHPGPVRREDIARLSAPVQVHCGTADRNVPLAQIKELDAILRAQRTPVETHLYEGADHGFLAYTRPYYKPDAAKLSWARTVAFLRKHLAA
jgi:carboxymethylenebutenolidase